MTKRNPRKVRWTKAYRKATGKDMAVVSKALLVLEGVLSMQSRAGPLQWHFAALPRHFRAPRFDFSDLQDATFEFEKRRNVPVRYDRDLMATTLRSMKRIDEIRTAREARYHAARMKGRDAVQQLADRDEIARGIRLVPPKVRESVIREAATAAGRSATEASEIEATLVSTGITTMQSLRKTGAATAASSSSSSAFAAATESLPAAPFGSSSAAAAASGGFVAESSAMGGGVPAADAFARAAAAAGASFSS
jgi:large subunit ribosomal protein L24e